VILDGKFRVGAVRSTVTLLPSVVVITVAVLKPLRFVASMENVLGPSAVSGRTVAVADQVLPVVFMTGAGIPMRTTRGGWIGSLDVKLNVIVSPIFAKAGFPLLLAIVTGDSCGV
jgi:hypothetical protein